MNSSRRCSSLGACEKFFLLHLSGDSRSISEACMLTYVLGCLQATKLCKVDSLQPCTEDQAKSWFWHNTCVEPWLESSFADFQSLISRTYGGPKCKPCVYGSALLLELGSGRLVPADAHAVHTGATEIFYVKPEASHLLAVYPLQHIGQDSDVLRQSFAQVRRWSQSSG